ncbi:MAG: hypothetical protein AAF456_22560 [Planctomycetota bacterium]
MFRTTIDVSDQKIAVRSGDTYYLTLAAIDNSGIAFPYAQVSSNQGQVVNPGEDYFFLRGFNIAPVPVANFYPGFSSWVCRVEMRPVLATESFTVQKGVLLSGGLAELAESDNQDVRIARDTFSLQSRVAYEVTATSPSEVPTGMSFTIEESVFARGNVTRTIELLDFNTGVYEPVDVRNASRLGDRVDTIVVTGDPTRFVQPGTRVMQARVRYQGPSPRAAFTCNVDQISWTVGD